MLQDLMDLVPNKTIQCLDNIGEVQLIMGRSLCPKGS
jgi:hypothetical protein